MEGIVNSKLVTYKRNRFVHRWWYRVVIWLAAGAVFITTYFLMLPALTATENEDPGTTQIVSGNIINDEIQVNNVFPVQAILGEGARYNGLHSDSTLNYFKNYDVILLHPNAWTCLGDFLYADKANVTVGQSFPSNFAGFPVDLSQWIGIRIEYATKQANASTLSYDYHYVSAISMEGSQRLAAVHKEYPGRIKNLAYTNDQGLGFILLIKKSYMDKGVNGGKMYWPACNTTETYEKEFDDKVIVNQTPLKSLNHEKWKSIYSDPGFISLDHDAVKNTGLDALAYITLSLIHI